MVECFLQPLCPRTQGLCSCGEPPPPPPSPHCRANLNSRPFGQWMPTTETQPSAVCCTLLPCQSSRFLQQHRVACPIALKIGSRQVSKGGLAGADSGLGLQGIKCWSGNDDEAHAARHQHNAQGVISVASNIIPGLYARLMQQQDDSLNGSLEVTPQTLAFLLSMI